MLLYCCNIEDSSVDVISALSEMTELRCFIFIFKDYYCIYTVFKTLKKSQMFIHSEDHWFCIRDNYYNFCLCLAYIIEAIFLSYLRAFSSYGCRVTKW